MIYNRYIKLRKAIRYPDGTIEYIVPFEEKKGELISQENFESLEDCLYDYIFRWYQVPLDNDDPNTYICEGFAQYYKEVYQKSTDGIHWSDFEPRQERKGDLVKEYSVSCGYVPLTKWVIIEVDTSNPDTYLCENGNLYQIQREYISYDNGKTYEPTDNVKKYKIYIQASEICDATLANIVIADKGIMNVVITYPDEYKPFSQRDITKYDFSRLTEPMIVEISYSLNQTDTKVKLRLVNYKPKGCVIFMGINEIVNLDTLDTTELTKMNSMFAGYGQQSIDVSNFNTSNVTTMERMFINCDSLVGIKGLNHFDTSKVTDMSAMFYFCCNLASLDVSNFNTSNVINMGGMFNRCRLLTSLNLSNFDTSKVTDMGSMFYDCNGLTSLNLSNFDTSKVTDMFGMFMNCSGLTSLNLSNFDTSKVTDMESMFNGCNSLASLNLSNFDTSKVTNMSKMFRECNSLASLNLSNFDTSNVINMNGMFINCNSLVSLNLSNFDTSKVTNMSKMFYGCSRLRSLDLSNFNTSSIYYPDRKNSVFYGCNSLTTIRCKQAFKDWCIANQDTINLPTALREGGSGTWEIV